MGRERYESADRMVYDNALQVIPSEREIGTGVAVVLYISWGDGKKIYKYFLNTSNQRRRNRTMVLQGKQQQQMESRTR